MFQKTSKWLEMGYKTPVPEYPIGFYIGAIENHFHFLLFVSYPISVIHNFAIFEQNYPLTVSQQYPLIPYLHVL